MIPQHNSRYMPGWSIAFIAASVAAWWPVCDVHAQVHQAALSAVAMCMLKYTKQYSRRCRKRYMSTSASIHLMHPVVGPGHPQPPQQLISFIQVGRSCHAAPLHHAPPPQPACAAVTPPPPQPPCPAITPPPEPAPALHIPHLPQCACMLDAG